jgi:hypothetical protein
MKASKEDVLYRKLQARREVLVSILRRGIEASEERSSDRDRIRHQIQNPQNTGYFIEAVCDFCYSELYCEEPDKESFAQEVICPGCGWRTTFPGKARG